MQNMACRTIKNIYILFPFFLKKQVFYLFEWSLSG